MGADRRGLAEVNERAGAGPPWAELAEALPAAFYVDRIDGTSVWVSVWDWAMVLIAVLLLCSET